MPSIPATICGAVVAPAFLCIASGAPALAEPSAELAQRPAESATPTVHAQPQSCLPRDSADDKLRSEFGEKVLGRGVSSDGTLVEIFQSPSGTFTVIKTTPKGMSCVVDFGEGWQTLNQMEAVDFSPKDLQDQETAPR
jgi:hypothetical protein